MKRFFFGGIFVCLLIMMPSVSFAAPSPALLEVFGERGDLQAAFTGAQYKAIPRSAAGFLIDIEDWAEQYGWREYPKRLAEYTPTSLLPVNNQPGVVLPEVTAEKYIVIDRHSRQILAASGASDPWPIASLTKLVTSRVALDQGVSQTAIANVVDEDDVGGAKLYVESGEEFTVEDLFYATLVGSANNAANALSRTTGISRDQFLQKMNAVAAQLNLSYTKFVDPTGIEVENRSTAREIARVAEYSFEKRDIRRFTSTAVRYVHALTSDTSKRILNTNWMLYKPEYDDIYIMSGKTGFLYESGWNLVVSIRPDLYEQDRELLIVLFGADSRGDSFKDARALADWTWITHEWE